RFVRVTFNEITKSAVTKAIANPHSVDMNRVNAQQTRRVLDRIVGYTVSPFLWKTVARNLSAGRVQSVALRLICEREEEVLAFTPQEYWNIAAILSTGKDEQFTARLYKIENKTVTSPAEKGPKKISITSENEVRDYLAELKKATYVVSKIKKSERKRKPLPPFITSTLQQDAARVYGFSPKATMSAAQRLYEGVEIGQEGSTGLITYMRTDSTRVSNEALSAVRKYIDEQFGKQYLPSKPKIYSKKKKAQDAHEAIRPTYMSLPPEKVRKKLTPQQFKLYTLIWNRFVASQMKEASFNVHTVDISADCFLFRVTAQKVKFDGFLKLYHESREPDENGNGENGAINLPSLEKDQQLDVKELKPTQSFTKPPARFSEAMLVKQLEADGIGRPSTYASIISTLKDRKYVESEERKLVPTDLGTTVNSILVKYLPDVFNVAFTAEMEQELDLIEDGTEDWVQVLRDFYEPFMETIQGLKQQEKAIKQSMVEKTDIACEKCGSPMVVKWGRNGRFMACSAYPDCKFTKPLPGEEEQSKTDEVCDKCGSPMIIKTGRFGRFLACSAYPECKNTKPITLGISCPRPDCGGNIVEKQTRGRKLFYGCSKYPKCDFASWDKPVKQPCPKCNYPFMVMKISKKRGEYLRCPECKHEIVKKSEPAEEPVGHETPS
ncbi:MAG: type I DNA topoisomerase, partial [candidate division Zixibacteria bacterium]|nr:type I DNA topoisomerase [candidate division Zixibacteria bacterium]